MTIHAGSLDRNVLQTLISDASVQPGDTVTIPAGTGTNWTTTLTVNKAITLQGAGVGQTIIPDDMAAGPLLDLALPTPGAFTLTRMTGVEFRAGTRPATMQDGIVRITGAGGGGTVDARRGRIDNCKFDHLRGNHIRVARAYGVIDNNIFLGKYPPVPSVISAAIYVQNPVVSSSESAWSDARWAEPNNFGQENFLFIEDNYFTCDTGVLRWACIDAFGGARFVFRYNHLIRSFVEAHGTESAGRSRGTRAIEYYNNDTDLAGASSTDNIPFVGMRSGVLIAHDNTGVNFGTGGSGVKVSDLSNQRTDAAFTPWGQADGKTPWDQNHAGNPVITGTVQTFNSTTHVVTVDPTSPGYPYTIGQFTGYCLRRTSAPYNIPIVSSIVSNPGQFTTTVPHGLTTGQNINIQNHSTSNNPSIVGTYPVTVAVPGSNTFTIAVNITTPGTGGFVSLAGSTSVPPGSAMISSNTESAIILKANFGVSIPLAPGDPFEINLIDRVLDQPGISGSVNYGGAIKPPLVLNTQTSDPCYEWNNTINGAPVVQGFVVSSAWSLTLTDGFSYYNDHRQKPGYTTYVHPHPLAVGGGSDVIAPGAPTGVTLT